MEKTLSTALILVSSLNRKHESSIRIVRVWHEDELVVIELRFGVCGVEDVENDQSSRMC